MLCGMREFNPCRALRLCSLAALPLLVAVGPRAQLSREMRRLESELRGYVAVADMLVEGKDDADGKMAAVSLLGYAEYRAEGLMDASARDAVLGALRGAMKKFDPHAELRATASSEAAMLLSPVVARYAEAGWFRAAATFGTLARRIDRGGGPARVAVDAVLREHRDAVVAAMPTTVSWEGAESVGTLAAAADDWTVTDGGVMSGELTKAGGDQLFISKSTLSERFVARVELTFDRHSTRGGLVFGYRDPTSYGTVEVALNPRGRANWNAKLRTEKGWKSLGNGTFAADIAFGQTLTLPLVVDAAVGGLRVTVADGEPMVIAEPNRGALLQGGRFGLVASARMGNDRHVTWSKLQLHGVEPRMASTQAFDSDAVDAALTVLENGAEDAVEASVCSLWRARAGLVAIADEAARAAQAERIGAALTAKDPQCAETLAGLRAAAQKLLDLGQKYGAKGVDWLAASLFEAAARCDAPTAAAALRALRAKRQAEKK